MSLTKKPEFKVGQLVYVTDENVYAKVVTYLYILSGCVGIRFGECEIRGLTARELGL